MNLCVQNNSVNAYVAQHLLCILKQPNPNPAPAMLWTYIINIFKRRHASLVMYVWLQEKNNVANKFIITPARHTT